MNQLPYSLLQICIEYMVPQRFVARNIIGLENRKQSVTYYFYKQQSTMAMLTHDSNGTLYLHHHNESIRCTDFRISATTMGLVNGKWYECYPNDDTMTYLLTFPEKRNPYCNQNPHPIIIQYLISHPQEMVWYIFSLNSHQNAIEYMLHHTYMIDWMSFCKNPSIEAVQYLLDHPEYIDWITFSQHPYFFEKVADVEMQKKWMTMLSTS